MADLTPGTCRVCGCTETSACEIVTSMTTSRACGWVAGTNRTLCDKSECLETAIDPAQANLARSEDLMEQFQWSGPRMDGRVRVSLAISAKRQADALERIADAAVALMERLGIEGEGAHWIKP